MEERPSAPEGAKRKMEKLARVLSIIQQGMSLSTGAIRQTSALYVVDCLDSLFAVSSRLPFWRCLSERRATHSPRNMDILGLLVSCGVDEAT